MFIFLFFCPPIAQSTTAWSDDLVVTAFQKSVPMVTYLACFVVSDFLYKEKFTESGVPVSCFILLQNEAEIVYTIWIWI